MSVHNVFKQSETAAAPVVKLGSRFFLEPRDRRCCRALKNSWGMWYTRGWGFPDWILKKKVLLKGQLNYTFSKFFFFNFCLCKDELRLYRQTGSASSGEFSQWRQPATAGSPLSPSAHPRPEYCLSQQKKTPENYVTQHIIIHWVWIKNFARQNSF